MTRNELAQVMSGKEPTFGHALAICLHATQLRQGWIYPAVAQDGWADNYSGTIPMGARLAIPSGVAMPSTVDTVLGRALWQTFTRYGGYVVDQCGSQPTFGVYADSLWSGADLNDGVAMYKSGDLIDIVRALRTTSEPARFAVPPTPTESSARRVVRTSLS